MNIRIKIQKSIEEKCQKGYKTHPKRKTKKMYGKTYRNCVKAEAIEEEVSESDEREEELQAIVGELEKASEMHASQAERIQQIIDDTEDSDLKEEVNIFEGMNCGCGQDPCKTYGVQEAKRELEEDFQDETNESETPDPEKDGDEEPDPFADVIKKSNIEQVTIKETEKYLEEALYYGLIEENLEEKKKKKACKPSKGKKFARRVKGRCVSYGQAGKAKGGGPRIKPGTGKGNAYCARSYGDMKSHGKDCSGKDRGTPLCLSRQKWKCSGKYSRKGK